MRMTPRLSYEDSYRYLQREGWEGEGDVPPLCDHIPRYDDEVLCLSFFRTMIEGGNLENLTIPRTYFSRTQIDRTSFRNTDLTESVANWNNFEDVDFSGADLTRLDLRGCEVIRTKFRGAILKDADLRCGSFEDCDFTDADMNGTKLTRETGAGLLLSSMQKAEINWHDEDGEEPDGG
jgi:uncharacterized protein YjbI with pentapeptide repeats